MAHMHGAVMMQRRIAWNNVDVYAYGNSWTANDIMNSSSSTRAINQLNTRMGFKSLTNRAVNGWTQADIAIDVTSTNARTWTVGTKALVILVNSLYNDMSLGSGSQSIASATNGLRTTLATLLASQRLEQTGFTFAGTWSSTATANAAFSGGSNAFTTNATGTWSKTLPDSTKDYFVLAHALVSLNAGRWVVTLDGNSVGTIEMYQQHLNGANTATLSGAGPTVLKIPAAGGAGVVLGTLDQAGRGTSTPGYIDAIFEQTTSNVHVVVMKPVIGVAATHNSTAARDAMRTVVDTVVPEFPSSNVSVCDIQAGWNTGTMLGADGVHPNDTGMTYVADQLEAHLRRLTSLGYMP